MSALPELLPLRERADRGVPEALEMFRTTDDPEVARGAATYLGLLPAEHEAKGAVLEAGIDRGELYTRAVTWPLRGATEGAVDRAIAAYISDPDAIGTYDVAFEAGLFFPHRLFAQRERIDSARLLQAMLPGAPDPVVDELEAAYRQELDPDILGQLAVVRTERSRAALRKLAEGVPEDDREQMDLYIEMSGVSPATGQPLVYPETRLGFLDARGASPHHMGAGWEGALPECPICETPGTRVLTVDAGAAQLPLSADPSLFWFSCGDDAFDYICVQTTSGGLEGLMVPMTDRAPQEPAVPGPSSLVLERHPNQHGVGLDVSAGFGYHQVGGFPPWIDLARHPHCPICSEPMMFVASVDSGPTLLGPMRFEGRLFGFWCDRDRVSCTMRQRNMVF